MSRTPRAALIGWLGGTRRLYGPPATTLDRAMRVDAKAGLPVDPIEYTTRWRVRSYELDSNGHVNNSVYLSWSEEIATMHAEAAGYGKDWTLARGGLWVIHRSEITYRRPAVYGDEVEVKVRVE